ncbi:ABC-F family ATP-binding cassette domain-containing protein [Gudongella sp. SC589]|jgi:ATP-binding cassette subfamily F protein uup|uniref:ABC-F family ATP-binding cassette domain-containing protein n=1 Tax=Gudongella sp. SC589 TaxID=3385990 RepID=UPI0039048797
MVLMTVENLSKSYVEKTLVENVTFGINEGDKIGLVGINGTGKSTLLKLLAGVEERDSGTITKGRDVTISYLPQNPEFDQDSTVLDQVFQGHWPSMRILREYRKALEGGSDQKEIIRLTGLMDTHGVWALEADAKTILTKLQITDFSTRVGDLSGGQRKRIALAAALIGPSDILILDEPTNHLDNQTIEWLEERLLQRKGALLMVTHDRYFLDRVTNQIMELEGGSLYSYKGNFSHFMEMKLQREENQKTMEDKRKSLYKKELQWMRQGAKARTTKQKARIQRFNALEESALDLSTADMQISVGTTRLGKKIIELKEVSKSYGDIRLFENFTYTLLRDDRIGILGENGTGKTTLLKVMGGLLEPDSGELQIGETVKIGFFQQETPFIDGDQRAIEYIRDGGEFITTGDGTKISASSMMERFLFPPDQQYTPLEKLSGGEKRRLYLLRVLMESPNVLLLDEPTNDLDIQTLQILEDYLEEFPGPVIVVSHDRYLLDKISEKVFLLRDGEVRGFTGNYDFFRAIWKEEEKKELKEEQPKRERSSSRNKALKFSFNEAREWETIEDELEELQEKIDQVDGEMHQAASQYTRLQELMEKKEELLEEQEKMMERWLYLSEKAEMIEKEKDS